MSLLQTNLSPHRCSDRPAAVIPKFVSPAAAYGDAFLRRCTHNCRCGVFPGYPVAWTRYVSKGLTRSRTDNLVVMRSSVTTIGSSCPSARLDAAMPRLALTTTEPEHQLSPTGNLEARA